jgi:hypothetical protein
MGPACRCQFSSSRAPSLSRGPGPLVAEMLPRTPLSPLSAPWTQPVSSAPFAHRGSARAHLRTSSNFSATTPAHAPSSLLRAPPVPRAHPSPHFTQLHPLSRSAHAASRRRRPAPAFPSIQLGGDRSKPPRAPPRGEIPVPVPNFPYCALCSANFAFASARPRWSAVLTR